MKFLALPFSYRRVFYDRQTIHTYMKPISSMLFVIILACFFSLLGVNAQTTIIVSSIGDDNNIGTVTESRIN